MQLYDYDLNEIKENLTIDEVCGILEDFNAEPEIHGDIIMARTIDHNYCTDFSASKKLYYYDNSHLFVSWTAGSDPFDIFQLVMIVKNREEGLEWELPQAIQWVAQRIGLAPKSNKEERTLDSFNYFKLIQNYERIKGIENKSKEVELKEYDDTILKNLPSPTIIPWIKEGISKEEMQRRGIVYDPKNCGIVIPHRDICGRLVGIRERSLIEENAELYGKYRPAYLNGKMYNHPLSFNLYGLDLAKDNIRRTKRAFVFEGEKSPMIFSCMFGKENNIAVAVCGSSFIAYQAWLLINLGVEEIIVGLDKQFKEKGDDEFKKLTKNLTNIHHKYGNYTKISFLFDKWNLLNYKSSPIDEGKEKFMELYRNRVTLY